MKEFVFTVRDELGLHARPAGALAKEAKKFSSEIVIEKDGKSAGANRLIALMGLGIKRSDSITVRIEGEDEEKAESAIKEFLEKNL